MSVPDPDAWKQWTPDAQRRALDYLRANADRPWRPFYCKIDTCDGRPHVRTRHNTPCEADQFGHWWIERNGKWLCDPEFGCGAKGYPVDPGWLHPHARADQKPPPWSKRWLAWVIASGRGGGKTLTGARLIHRVAERERRMIFVAQDASALRETMVEGESGILATAEPGKKPKWEPSRKKLTWPNGAIAIGYSAEEPDRLRGPQSGFLWLDEAAHYPLIEDVWSNALFGLRLGNPSHILVTSTPKPIPWFKTLLKEDSTVLTRVSTYANLYNLDPAYRQLVINQYEGTRTGRQELHGELLEDVEGSLWNSDMLQHGKAPAELERVVVAVDPAGTANARSDETGIIVVGIAEGIAYVLHDFTGKYSPAQWGAKAWWAHEKYQADCIVAEKNYGADMVRHVLDNATGERAKIHLVQSRRGKALRAEPMVAHYEKKRVVHAGDLAKLEDEMLTWVPGEGSSPNRVDALVHGLTELFRRSGGVGVASPTDLLPRLPQPGFGARNLPRGL